MKERRLFEGQLGDLICGCIKTLIKTAKENNESVYLLWNGKVLTITPRDTEERLMLEYERMCRAESLLAMEDRGELLEVNDLSARIAKAIMKFMED